MRSPIRSQIAPGARFAYRSPPKAFGAPVREVEVVRRGPRGSNKVRVRWLDGEYEGLEEWVPTLRLLAPWDEVDAFRADEWRMLAAVAASGDVAGTVRLKAVECALYSLPLSLDVGLGYSAAEVELLYMSDVDDQAHQLGLDAEELKAEPHAYVDRCGVYKAPFPVADKVARHCCRRFGREILAALAEDEEKLRRDLVEDLDLWRAEDRREFAEKRLREQEPVLRLVREWCGESAARELDEIGALRSEVRRLRRLLADTAEWIRHAGHARKASYLESQLRRSDAERA